jgi:hypothetical protein
MQPEDLSLSRQTSAKKKKKIHKRSCTEAILYELFWFPHPYLCSLVDALHQVFQSRLRMYPLVFHPLYISLPLYPYRFTHSKNMTWAVRIINTFNFDSRTCLAGPLAGVSWETLRGWMAAGLRVLRRGKISQISTRSSSALGLTQLPVQWVLKVKRLDFPVHPPLHLVLRSRIHAASTPRDAAETWLVSSFTSYIRT